MGKAGPNRKRKVQDEKRQFQDSWTERYVFVQSVNNIVCLICKSTVAVPKEYSIRHYENLHSIFLKLPQELRKQKLSSLKQELADQQ